VTVIREAREEDTPQIVDLIGLLDHAVDASGVARRMKFLADQGIPQLVATEGDVVIGLCGLHVMVALHRERAVGRVTILVVREDMRGSGIGRRLLQAAEQELRNRGCGLVEITSNQRLEDAHLFYEHWGYERTSFRFMKRLEGL
jgi:GNAT superfamily N-acetyltransferase